jgi:uncharacterized HAD superfamily protein|tara:strand:- start:2304 stop:2672 length:369 start_codon:yes stop_codon:yes gene_type:complete
MKKKLKIVCDIDGVLCENNHVPYLRKKPFNKEINILRQLYRSGHKIILYTARRRRFVKNTRKWLKKHNVLFHKLVMEKPKGHIYIDDRSSISVSQAYMKIVVKHIFNKRLMQQHGKSIKPES